VLYDRIIDEILGDGQNSDLSDFSDESDFEEVFNADELHNLLAINEFFEPFEDDYFEVNQNIGTPEETVLDAQNLSRITYCITNNQLKI